MPEPRKSGHSRSKRVALNAALLSFQHIVVTFISIFSVGYIARKLGQENYGVFSLAFAFPVIFMTVGSMGLRPLTIREVSAHKEEAFGFVGKIVPLRLILLSLAFLITLSAAFFLYDDPVVLVGILIGGLTLGIEHAARIAQDIFQAFEEVWKITARSILVKVLVSAGSVAALFVGLGLYSVCWIYLAGTALGLVLNVVLYRNRFAWPCFSFDKEFAKTNFRLGASFLLAALAMVAYSKLDIILLSKMMNNSAVGEYNAAVSLFYQLNFISDAIATSVFPALSSLFHTDREEAQRVFSNGLTLMLIAALPIAAGGAMLSEKIILMIYGNGYASSAPLFFLSCLCIPFLYLSTLFAFALGAVGRQRLVTVVMCAACFVNLIANLFLIRAFGTMGAALTALITQLFIFLLLAVPLFGEFRFRLFRGFALGLPVSLAGMALCVFLLRDAPVLVTVAAGGLAYFALLVLSTRNVNLLFRTVQGLRGAR